MTDETKNIRIKVGLDGLGSTQRDLETLQRLLSNLGRASTGIAGGVTTPGANLNALTQDFLKARKTTDIGYSKLESAVLAEAQARQARARFIERSKIAVGEEGGFKSGSDLVTADLATAKRLNDARGRLATTLEKSVKAEIRAQEDAQGLTAAREAETRAIKEAAAAAKLAAQQRQQWSDEAARAARALNQAEVDAAEAQRARVARMQREDSQFAFGANSGPLFQRENALPQSRIDELSAIKAPDTSALGRIIARASTQEAALGRANEGLAEIRRKAAAGELLASQSEALLPAAAAKVATAEQQLAQTLDLLKLSLGRQVASSGEAAAAFAQQGPLSRQKGQFLLGFKGASDVPIGQQVGQAFKFSLLYGSAYKALFLLTQTFQDALQEGIAFQQGLSDMAITTGHSKESLQDLAENLAAQASATGASPSQGLEVGARAIGLYGATSAPLDQQKLIAQYSNGVISKLAAGSGMQPVDLQASIAAITQALGTGFSGQGLVADLDAYFTKKFGIAQGSTFDAVAQSATVGLSAGFSPEQLFGIAADLQSRTGQTSTAVGGYLAQIFSRGGEGSLTSVAQSFGIDTNQTLKQILDQLAKIYQTATPNQRTDIAAAFGRGKVQNAAIALLGDYGTINSEVKKAQGGAATGALDKSFTERINNIGGQISVLGGDFKEFAHLLGESGLLAALGLGVEALHQFISATNDVLRLFTELPGPLKDLLGVLAAAGLAKAVIPGIAGSAAGGAVGRLATNSGVRGLATKAAGGLGLTGMLGLGGVASEGGLAALGAAAGPALLAAAPFAAAAAGVFALAKLGSSIHDSNDALQTGISAINQAPGPDATAGQVKAYASLLRNQAKQDRDQIGFFTGISGKSDDLRGQAKQLSDLAAAQEAYAKALDHQAKSTANKNPALSFSSFGDADIQAGLQSITDNGGTAATQVKALSDAINGLGKHAADAAGRIDPRGEANGLTAALGALKGSFAGQSTSTGTALDDSVAQHNLLAPYLKVSSGDLSGELQKALSSQLQKRLKAALGSRGLTSFNQLNKASTGSIAAEISKLDRSDFSNLSDSGFADYQQAVTDAVRKYLLKRLQGFKHSVDGATHLSAAQAAATANAVLASSASDLADKDQFDFAGKLKVARGALRDVLAVQKNGDSSPQLLKDIRDARSQIAQVQIDRLEALRKVAVQNAKTQAQASAAGRGFVRKEIEAAVRAGDGDLLAQVLQGAGKGAVEIAKKVVADALKTAKAAQGAESQMAGAQRLLKIALQNAFNQVASALQHLPFAGPTGMGPIQGPQPVILANGQFAGATPANSDLQNQLQNMMGELNSGTIGYDSNPDQIPGAKPTKPKGDSAAAIAAARYAAMAARRGGDVFAARAGVLQARADISDAKKGTVAYYNALASLYQAQDQLNEALRAARFNRKSLKLDLTDPVVQARLDYQQAIAKLRSDQKRGKSGAVTTQDKLDAKNAKNALEQSQFDQRLSDIQTADSLGQVTHSAYIRYLQHEHDRLKAVAHRTRQQQDELNQIDQLMLDASKAMNGAFNFGDIKLPTPYQVRRYVEEQAGVRSGRLAASQTQVYSPNVYITTGADPAQVRKVVTEVVGKNARVMTTQTRRR